MKLEMRNEMFVVIPAPNLGESSFECHIIAILLTSLSRSGVRYGFLFIFFSLYGPYARGKTGHVHRVKVVRYSKHRRRWYEWLSIIRMIKGLQT